jgi:hypothetical protein
MAIIDNAIVELTVEEKTALTTAIQNVITLVKNDITNS